MYQFLLETSFLFFIVGMWVHFTTKDEVEDIGDF